MTCKIDESGRECTNCGEYKEWQFFYRKCDGIREKMSQCKPCTKKQRNNGNGQGAKFRGAADERGRECSRCGIYKEWANYQKLKSGPNGHCSRCKACKNLMANGLRQPHIRKKIKTKITKKGRNCSLCKFFKPYDDFHNESGGARGKSSICKACSNLKAREKIGKITDGYVSRLVRSSCLLRKDEIPASLIEAKRQHLILTRELKGKNHDK